MKVPPPRSLSDQTSTAPNPAKQNGVNGILVALLLLFSVRVGAQLIQWVSPTTGLPPFASWQSGLIPYPVLLGFQLAIIVVGTVITGRMAAGRLHVNPRFAAPLLSVGSVYFAAMAYRFGYSLIAGMMAHSINHCALSSTWC